MKAAHKRRRLLYIVGGAALIFLVANYGVLPWLDHQEELRNEKSSKEASLARMIGVIRKKSTYEQGLAKIQNSKKVLMDQLLAGKDAAALSGELTLVVKNMCEAQGISIQRIDAGMKPERFDAETLKRTPELADFQKVKIVVALKCTPPQLANLLGTLEAYPRLIVLDRMEIRAYNVADDKSIAPYLYLMSFLYAPQPHPQGGAKKPAMIKT